MTSRTTPSAVETESFLSICGHAAAGELSIASKANLWKQRIQGLLYFSVQANLIRLSERERLSQCANAIDGIRQFPEHHTSEKRTKRKAVPCEPQIPMEARTMQ